MYEKHLCNLGRTAKGKPIKLYRVSNCEDANFLLRYGNLAIYFEDKETALLWAEMKSKAKK